MTALDGKEALIGEILQHLSHVAADRLAWRVEFLGETVESLRLFDPATQKSTAKMDRAMVLPAREYLRTGNTPDALAPIPADAEWRAMDHAAWLYRDGLAPVAGLDDGGPMGAMALGWVTVLPEGDRPLMLNKSGGLQGQFSYVVIAPTRGVGVFVSMNAFSVGGFPAMVKAANDLIAELAPR